MNLRQLVLDTATAFAQANQPFTSGHVTTRLRQQDPTLCFSARTVGQILTDSFAQGILTPFANTGTIVSAMRVTSGLLGRTPAGINVQVYAGDHIEADTCLFEVDIPVPPTVQVAPPAPTTPAVVPTPVPQNNTPSGTYHAYVLNDGRAYIPAAALQAAGITQAASVTTLPAGSQIRVANATPAPGTYKVQVSGRVAFPVGTQYTGQEFPLTVGTGEVTFDLV